MRPMLRVGLTGNIGCGKSTAAKFMADLGAYVIDADAIGHELLRPGTDIYAQVQCEFGKEVLDKNGVIDRKKLGSLVFASPGKLKSLSNLIHPAVRAEISRRALEISQSDPRAIILVESALMVETDFYRQLDYIIVVTCKPEIQVQRTQERTGLSREDVEARISRQMPQEEKAKVADAVLDNSGGLNDLRQMIQTTYQELVRLETAGVRKAKS
jgi:dephospho-CoA kinase